MLAAIIRNIQAATANPNTHAITLLLRSMADFPMLSENTNAVRRRELAIPYLTRRVPDSLEADSIAFAMDVVKGVSENLACKHHPFSEGGFPDLGLCPLVETLPDLLRGLLFRGRLQSDVFQVFLQLCQQNICHVSALHAPVDLRNNSPQFNWLFSLMFCWELNQGKYSGSETFTPIQDVDSRWINLSGHLRWLAVMIRRSACNISEAVQVITLTKYFGRWDDGKFQKLQAYPLKIWQPDLLFCAGSPGQDSGFYGFMLPSEIQITPEAFDAIQVRFWRNFDPIEKAFEQYFQIPPREKFSLGNHKDDDTDPRDWQQTIYT